MKDIITIGKIENVTFNKERPFEFSSNSQSKNEDKACEFESMLNDEIHRLKSNIRSK